MPSQRPWARDGGATKQTGRMMKRTMSKRIMTTIAAALALAALAPAPAQGQAWPQKPIKMIVPFPAGGGTDFIARLAAKHLSQRLGQQVYVENRGGANGA